MSDRIHEWFGLSYANYLVIQRTFLQSMPDEWQDRLVKCLEELWEKIDEEIEGGQLPEGYWVRARNGNKFVKDNFSNYERGRRKVFRSQK